MTRLHDLDDEITRIRSMRAKRFEGRIRDHHDLQKSQTPERTVTHRIDFILTHRSRIYALASSGVSHSSARVTIKRV
ncbi:hypothetical protein [Microbacterium sp. CIAB417]|uniref:hypothetical protein n=1 Tax=Microbacterium sp. CIAB417 TaxID=2860287 RepID=UPI001FABD543|nr:hypothetical protein [Microbacterium sp. CIAB417]